MHLVGFLLTSMHIFFDVIEYLSTCFGWSLTPSSGVQYCTHRFRYMSYRFLKETEHSFHLVAAIKQPTSLYDTYLNLYVQYWTPDDGRRDIQNIQSDILYIHGSLHRETNLITVQQDATLFSSLYFCRQLYMFRVLTPKTRSSYNCSYSFWHWSAGCTNILSCC